jgi:hypothetical protein
MAPDGNAVFYPEASQDWERMLQAIVLGGDSDRSGRHGIHFEPMIPGTALKNLKNKACRRASSFGLTPTALGHNISMVRGFYFFRPN